MSQTSKTNQFVHIEHFFSFKMSNFPNFDFKRNKRCLPGSKIPQRRFLKVFNVWTKSHFSNLEVG